MDSFEFTKTAGSVIAALLLIFGTRVIVEINADKPLTTAGYTLPSAEPAPKKGGEAGAKSGAAEKPKAEAKAAEGEGETPPKESNPPQAKTGDEAAPAKAAGEAPGAAAGGGVVALLSKANPENGKAAFSKCKDCHVAQKGQKPTVGPNLWGVVNRPKASTEFTYSEALKAQGGAWTFADLSAFIRNPKGFVAGTKMSFAGISDPAAEADIIAYLATLADAPVPLPK